MTASAHHRAYLLLGSNLGDRAHFLQAARQRLAALDGFDLTAASSIYLTEPVDMADRSLSFLNQVIAGEYRFTPGELLTCIERIERELGRSAKGQRLARTIDIDILLFGDQVISTDRLTVPHPRLTERAFAIVPLLEIDPNLEHPQTGRLLRQYVTVRAQSTVALYEDHVSRIV
jgi:2-amino-4-hydroxy-6-hydroxymethyldihydropteridine diphosphokinase